MSTTTNRRPPAPGRTAARNEGSTATKQPGRASNHKSGRAVGQKWARQLHTWLSTTSLLVVLFFAVTGITLDPPPGFGAPPPPSHIATGSLPSSVLRDGSADPLAISEYLRSSRGVTGQV